jgi:hypothetical protein
MAEVVGDPKDPGRDFRGIFHAVQVFLDPDKGILDQVIGDRFVPYRSQDELFHPFVEFVMDFQKVHQDIAKNLSAT